MPDIIFIYAERGAEKQTTLKAEKGQKIIEAARRGGIKIETPCNGLGTCGKCGVRDAGTGEFILACQGTIEGDAAYILRDYENENDSLRILSEGSSFDYSLEPFITKRFVKGRTEVYGGEELWGLEDHDTSGLLYGIAVDIGTTTIVANLVDIAGGKCLASVSALNPQAHYAQDVLGRIHFAGRDGGLQVLYRAFIEKLNQIIGDLIWKTKIKAAHIYELVYSGNTTMLHLACNVDPSGLGKYPYTPAIYGGCHVMAKDLAVSPFARIYLPPVISAYVGADITSGLLITRLEERKGSVLFIDIGTNGEMAFAKDGRIAASSTAAGPAFEGMNISCGMRASAGAVESFAVNGDGSCVYAVIGGGKNRAEAAGICGSGLLDIAGELVRTGVIDSRGRFVPPDKGSYSDLLKERMGQIEGKNAFFITGGVYLAQKDIRQIQLAKGAIRCGIEMLLSRFAFAAGAGDDAGDSPADIDEIIIAGSFGYHLNEESLLNIGLLPPRCRGKISFAGNTSLSGAEAFLLNASFRRKMKEVTAGVEKIELAQDAEFERTFIKYMGF
ncbi:MAG: ASKHA domain-containing protein [Treponema sp.]|jgi:uncharacterized 2Fe-2S/4Fe-4S cluster protein (DUF4445 family)|nr:ASKHA domain-containing protein [Treponema sp.]